MLSKVENTEDFVLFKNEDLVPAAWKTVGEKSETADDLSSDVQENRFRVFNPSLIKTEQGFAMVYRVVDEASSLRRLATCRLTPSLTIVKNSATALSDIVQFAARDELDERALTWHADPRYFRLQGKIFVLWNDGGNKPYNHQFLQEMSADGLRPVGTARELVTDLERRTTEKNWMFFENDEGVWATYAIYPHHVLSVDLSGSKTVMCRNATQADWNSDYSEFYGVLRGSAQPIRMKDDFLTIAHSSYKTTKGRVYQACFYRFALRPPFNVTAASRRPFEIPNPIGDHFEMPRLNHEVHKVVYPCGFVESDGKLLVSFGINDEICAIAQVALGDVLESISPVNNVRTVPAAAKIIDPLVDLNADADFTLPVFWWNASGKKFDGSFGSRNFHIGNFGDIAAAEVVSLLSGGRTRVPGKKERKIVAIGSVLHTASDGDLIWGSGAKGTKMQLDPSVKHLNAYAVRGPLTLGVLLRSGIDTSKITHLFDPGVLIPRLYEKEVEAYKTSPDYRPGGLRIIPHYRDDLLFRREYPEYSDQMITVDCTPLGMTKALLGADMVISSSLHGIIFAEAMGIPAYWHGAMGGEDEVKFYDYYYGTGRYHIKRFETLYDALKSEPMPLPTFDFDAYIKTFPLADMMTMSKPAAPALAAPVPIATQKPAKAAPPLIVATPKAAPKPAPVTEPASVGETVAKAFAKLAAMATPVLAASKPAMPEKAPAKALKPAVADKPAKVAEAAGKPVAAATPVAKTPAAAKAPETAKPAEKPLKAFQLAAKAKAAKSSVAEAEPPKPASVPAAPIALSVSVAAKASPDIKYDNFLPPAANQSWSYGRESEITILQPGGVKPPHRVVVEMQLIPHNPRAFKRPQCIELAVNGSYAITIEWPAGDETARKIDISVETNGVKAPILLNFQSRNARTPRSMHNFSHPFAEHQLSFSVKDLKVTRL